MPVGFVARAPFFVMTHPSVEAKTLPELIALEKAKPGTLSVATDGQRNFSGMLTAWLGKLGGVNFTQVPVHGDAAGHSGYGRRPRAGGDPGGPHRRRRS